MTKRIVLSTDAPGLAAVDAALADLAQDASGNGALFLAGDGTFKSASTGTNFLGVSLVAPPTIAGGTWSQVNFTSGSSAADVANGILFSNASGIGSDNVSFLSRAAPTAPYTVTAFFALHQLPQNGGSGLGFSDGTKFQTLTTDNQHGFLVQNFDNDTTYDSNEGENTFSAEQGVPQFAPLLWLRISDDGTNVHFYYSVDGVYFVAIYSVAKSSGFLESSGYTHVGPTFNPHGSYAAACSLVSWQGA
jgi:hypothetical protein